MIGRAGISCRATALRYISLVPSLTQQQTLWHFLRVSAPKITVHQDQKRLLGSRHLPAPKLKALSGRLPRDEQISYPYVHLRDEDGKLSEPQLTKPLLKSLDQEKWSLVAVAMPSQDRKEKRKTNKMKAAEDEQDVAPEDSDSKEMEIKWPIVMIVDRKAEYADHLRKHQESVAKWRDAKMVQLRTKRIELRWAIARKDLNTKLCKVQALLRKGYRVDLVLLDKGRIKKGKKKMATLDEAIEVLRIVETAVAEIPGTKEHQAREGKVGRELMIYYEGVKIAVDSKEGAEKKEGEGEEAEEKEDEEVEEKEGQEAEEKETKEQEAEEIRK